MKKLFAMLLALLIAIGAFAGCSVSTGQSEPAPIVEKVESNEPEKTTDPNVTITGYDIVTDSEGKNCVVLFLTWTNTSEETTMFATSYTVSAYQDGIGLESSILINDKYTDLCNACLTEIRPGATLDVAVDFALRSDNPIIEIEVDEWISFDDEILISSTIDMTK